MTEDGHLAFDIPATSSAIDGLCSQADAWLKGNGLATECFAVAMLLREGLNNAMLHGCGNDPFRSIHCELERRQEWLHLLVEDPGPGFDWGSRCECRAGIEDCHGRGLQIYELYAEEVAFNKSGNRVSLKRRIAGGSRRDSHSAGNRPECCDDITGRSADGSSGPGAAPANPESG